MALPVRNPLQHGRVRPLPRPRLCDGPARPRPSRLSRRVRSLRPPLALHDESSAAALVLLHRQLSRDPVLPFLAGARRPRGRAAPGRAVPRSLDRPRRDVASRALDGGRARGAALPVFCGRLPRGRGPGRPAGDPAPLRPALCAAVAGRRASFRGRRVGRARGFRVLPRALDEARRRLLGRGRRTAGRGRGSAASRLARRARPRALAGGCRCRCCLRASHAPAVGEHRPGRATVCGRAPTRAADRLGDHGGGARCAPRTRRGRRVHPGAAKPQPAGFATGL